MKRVLISVLLSGIVSAASGAALKATIKYDTSRSLSGDVEGRSGGSVVFRPQGAAPVSLAESRVVEIEFRMEGLAELSRAIKNEAYGEAVAVGDRVLEPALDYLGIAGNLSEYVYQWMAAAYWSGEYARVADLADKLKGSGDSEIMRQADYFGRLARLQEGSSGEMAVFLETPEADTLYPEGSAARLYIDALMLKNEGQTLEALRAAARIIAGHARDTNWSAQADLLCAELYFELDMPDSAKAVIEDIKAFYKNESIKNKAAMLAANQE